MEEQNSKDLIRALVLSKQMFDIFSNALKRSIAPTDLTVVLRNLIGSPMKAQHSPSWGESLLFIYASHKRHSSSLNVFKKLSFELILFSMFLEILQNPSTQPSLLVNYVQ